MVSSSLRVLGIDPGYGRCGWGMIAVQGHRQVALAHGVIETMSCQPFPERLLVLHQELSQVIKEFYPQEVAVEQLYFSKNTKTAIDVGQARGVILLTCAQLKVQLSEYKPVEIKQAVTGFGHADKKQVQHMIKMILNLSAAPRLDDAADALAVALCHAHCRQSKTIVNQYQTK